MKFTDPSQKFALLWVHGIKATTEIVTEHRFHPVRAWRFDYAHVPTKVAIEIEGGIGMVKTKTGKRVSGHHIQRQGYKNDCEKYNEATRLGWRIFRLTPEMVNAIELERIAAFIKQQPIQN